MAVLLRPGTDRSDGELVDAILDGDRGAFTDVLRKHDDRLRGLAFKLLGGDRHRMDDAMQDAYVRAYKALPRFRRDADLGSWLYRITYSACIDELRRTKRRAEPIDLTAPAAEPAARASGPEHAVVAADAAARALAVLPEDQRITVVLVDGEGFDNQTAARILGVAPGTVASRLSRARAAMRHELGRTEEVEP
jgi:RNA polymerase sigma-70 factor (ECF subfamily)